MHHRALSFTPVYEGARREVEIGVLSTQDDALALKVSPSSVILLSRDTCDTICDMQLATETRH